MSYTALYRKFRPNTFADVKGQEHIVTTLKNQIKSDRIGHAYLFCGTRGTGKTTIAKILAKAVNCEQPVDGSPCGVCAMCRSIQDGTSMNVIEIDAASNNGVDNIREIREEVMYRPAQGRYKVYIIDEVHMLSKGAYNALLKTLEEPPSYAIFILATTEAHAIPVTILSRCQRYDFRRIPAEVITDRLAELMKKENIRAEKKALRYIAGAADGSLRDALSLLDQCTAFYMGQDLTYEKVLEVLGTVDVKIFSEMLRQVLRQDVAGVIRLLEDLVQQGKELGQLVTDFIWYLRNLLLLQTSDETADMLDVSEENLELLREESHMTDMDTLMRYIRVLSELSGQLRYATQKRVQVEIAFVKLCRPAMETNLDSVLDRLRVLEERAEAGTLAASPASTSPGFESVPTGKRRQIIEAKKPEPKKAAPEDLQRIAGEWQRIIKTVPQRALRIYLSEYTKLKYDSKSPASELYVVISDDMAENYCKDETVRKNLEALIEEQMGIRTEVKLMLQAEKGAGDLAEIEIDDILKGDIMIDVEVEES